MAAEAGGLQAMEVLLLRSLLLLMLLLDIL